MSRSGRTTAEFAGEEREFLLAWGELIELQEKRDAGPSWILQRLVSGQWKMEDVSEIIRLGLIGANEVPAIARKLVVAHVESRPFDMGGEDGLVVLAVKILSASLYGAPDEPVGKPVGEMRNGSTISPEEKSDSVPSSVTLS